MSGQEVPRVRTPLSPEDLVDVLARGHHAALGEPPGEQRLRMAWAQAGMFELGGGRYCWCDNIGNVTAGPNYAGLYFVDVERERVRKGPDDHPELDVFQDVTLHFRAHRDPIDGAADYWRRLSGEFAAALPFFDSGDVHGAMAKLSELNYFTARLGPYERAVAEIARHFDDALWRWP